MTNEDIHQRHDKLFAIGFGDPATAAGLLKAQLPPALVAQVDWSALKAESGTFIDPEFRKTQSDLLFSATLSGRPCKLYILFEHQIQEDPDMALRLLRYMINIWWPIRRANPGKKLPIILPVVLAQNAKKWKVKPIFSSILDIPEGLEDVLSPYLPDFCFDLLQLAEHTFDSLPGTAAGILLLRVMKAERLAQLLHDSVWDEGLIKQVPAELFHALLRYILAADIDKEAFKTKIQEIKDPQTQTSAMTLAHQLRQEGTSGAFRRLVQRKFPSILSKVAPVLERMDEERLMAFGEALLFMQTPEECLEWLATR